MRDAASRPTTSCWLKFLSDPSYPTRFPQASSAAERHLALPESYLGRFRFRLLGGSCFRLRCRLLFQRRHGLRNRRFGGWHRSSWRQRILGFQLVRFGFQFFRVAHERFRGFGIAYLVRNETLAPCAFPKVRDLTPISIFTFIRHFSTMPAPPGGTAFYENQSGGQSIWGGEATPAPGLAHRTTESVTKPIWGSGV